VLSFHSSDVPPDGAKRRKVDVIVARPELAPLACILNFHSTLVMNFICWDAAYSMFPSATFLRHTCLTFGESYSSNVSDTIHAKYWRRGFKIPAIALPVHSKGPPDPSHPERFIDRDTGIQFGERFVGDRNMWRIPLNTSGLLDKDEAAKAQLYSDCLRANGFNLLTHNIPPSEDTQRNPGRLFYTDGAQTPVLFFKIISSMTLETQFILPIKNYVDLNGFLRKQEKLMWRFLTMAKRSKMEGEDEEPEEMEVDRRFWDAEILQILRGERMVGPAGLI